MKPPGGYLFSLSILRPLTAAIKVSPQQLWDNLQVTVSKTVTYYIQRPDNNRSVTFNSMPAKVY
jgi:hypothetical protein